MRRIVAVKAARSIMSLTLQATTARNGIPTAERCYIIMMKVSARPFNIVNYV